MSEQANLKGEKITGQTKGNVPFIGTIHDFATYVEDAIKQAHAVSSHWLPLSQQTEKNHARLDREAGSHIQRAAILVHSIERESDRNNVLEIVFERFKRSVDGSSRSERAAHQGIESVAGIRAAIAVAREFA